LLKQEVLGNWTQSEAGPVLQQRDDGDNAEGETDEQRAVCQ
jgi:hypothetical protein